MPFLVNAARCEYVPGPASPGRRGDESLVGAAAREMLATQGAEPPHVPLPRPNVCGPVATTSPISIPQVQLRTPSGDPRRRVVRGVWPIGYQRG